MEHDDFYDQNRYAHSLGGDFGLWEDWILIAICGIDGVGKTVQIELLKII